MYIPDNYDMWEAHDREQNQWLEGLPKCKLCGDPIQQEDALCIGGNWYCDECIEMNRKEIEL